MSMIHRISAFRELLGRYRDVFAHHWALRGQYREGMFTENEAEFLPPALSLQERPVSSTAKLTARILMLLVAVAILWSTLGHIDIIVNAKGKIIPSGHTKTIASVDVASVRAIHVSEGQHVKAGDVLIELDTRESDAERDKALGGESDAVLQVARAQALIEAINRGAASKLPGLDHISSESHVKISQAQWSAAQTHLDSEYSDFVAKLGRVDGDILRFGQALPLATQRANDYHALLQEHDVAEHAWLEKEQARVDLEGQLADARNQRKALIADTKRTAFDQLAEGRKSIESFRQDAIRSNSHSDLMQLRAPVDGTVQQLTVHTVGGVVPVAQSLMEIVPFNDSVEVEAYVENKDIGFVQAGQSAEVKIDAFEYAKYGTIPSKVLTVSRDAIQDERKDFQDEKKDLMYSAKVMMLKAAIDVEGKSTPLTPGMAVNVEIKTGNRRIIDYVLAPLLQHKREALHER